jgi:Tfp pilus assembly protein PilF
LALSRNGDTLWVACEQNAVDLDLRSGTIYKLRRRDINVDRVAKTLAGGGERGCGSIPSWKSWIYCLSVGVWAILPLAVIQSRLIALLILACSLLSANSDARDSRQNRDAQAHVDAGMQFAQAGKLESAEAEFRQALELGAPSAALLANLGTILAMERKLEESSDVFKEALRLNSRDVTARRYLAANLWQLHRFPEAKYNLEILLKEKPSDEQGLLLFGMVSENLKDYVTAARVLASVPGLTSARPESIAALARSYYHLGEKEKARRWLDQLRDAPSVFLGGQIADEARDYQTAEKLLASVQSSFPDQGKVGYSLALVQYHAKRFAEAQSTLARLLSSGYQTSDIYNLLGWCSQQQQHHKDAVHAFQEAVKLDPQNERNYLDLGTILLAAGRLIPALELAKRTANAFPASSRAFVLKGQVELQVTQFSDAVDSFAHAMQLDAENPDATVGLARAQTGAGIVDRAKTTLEAAIVRFPEKARFEVELAQLLLKDAETGNNGAEARAEQLLNSAVARDDTLVEAHYQLAGLALRRGQAQLALQHLKKATKLDPESAKIHFALSRIYHRLGHHEEAAKQAALYEELKEKETRRQLDASTDAPSNN